MKSVSRQGYLLGAVILLLSACAEHPPTTIENRSVSADNSSPEVRRSGAPEQDYGAILERGPDYIVRAGDTLYSVAFRLGMDYRELAAVNGIDAPYVIRIGQPLKTVASPQLAVSSQPSATDSPKNEPAQTQPKTASASPAQPKRQTQTVQTQPVTPPSHALSTAKTPPVNAPVSAWLWPGEGAVSRAFSSELHKGIDIEGQRGDPVKAAANGLVVYAGTGVTGYGALLIVKHNDTYLSAYGHNDALLAVEGEWVEAGQVIAKMGSTGTDSVKLHFEIRKSGQPVSPTVLLPRR